MREWHTKQIEPERDPGIKRNKDGKKSKVYHQIAVDDDEIRRFAQAKKITITKI